MKTRIFFWFLLIFVTASSYGQPLPARVDNRAYMPQVRDQGIGNSCTGFAVANALSEFRNKELGYSPANEFSPAFVYNLSNKQNHGALLTAALLVENAGCSKLSDFPYVAGNWQTLPSRQVLKDALSNSVTDVYYFPVGDSIGYNVGGPGYEGINKARALIASDKPVVMSLTLTEGYGGTMASENWIYSYAACGNLPFTGGHALCIVGYDDTMPTRDGQGAFLVINSWGADKFDQGYSWITYQLLARKNYQDAFFTFNPRPANYQPEFTAEFELQNFVNQFGMFYRGFVVNGKKFEKNHLWVYRYGNLTSSNGQPLIPQPLPDHSFIDMSDLAGHLDPQGENKFFISGEFYKSLFHGTYPEIISLHLVDHAKGIDTLITTNLVIQDSVFYAEWKFRAGIVDAVADDPSVPASCSLSQNYPNPFNPATMISFSLVKPGKATLKVYDLLGREVATLVNGYMSAGAHSVKFDASRLSSGIYIYRIQSETYADSKKMILMK